MDHPDLSYQIVMQSDQNKTDIRSWKFNDVMYARPEVM